MATREEIAEETARVRKARHLVDFSTALIAQSRMPPQEAELLVAFVREQILTWFPDGEQAYEIIYAPRFRRILREAALSAPGPRGAILPFRPR